MTKRQENLIKLLSPEVILFIGSKKIIRQGIKNCLQIGFAGEIYVVHPKESMLEGFPCYDSIQTLPKAPDAAFIAVNKEQTVSVVRQLNEIGTHGAVCYAAGFAESGAGDLQEQLITNAGDMVLVGPNCYGVLNFLDNAALWPDHYGSVSVDSGAAIISQSGNLSMNMTMAGRTLPLAYMISVGNQASLGIGDYIEALIENPRVNAIGIYMEGLDDLDTFQRAAEKSLQKGVPIVVLKTGRSETGSQLTMSHTSSMAGSDELYNALFERFHILRVDTLSALTETLKLFCVTGSMESKKLGVLTCSGGESTIMADFAAEYGFSLPALTDEQTAALKERLTKFEHVSNPLDYNTSIWGNEPELIRCFRTFMQGDFAVTVLVLDYLISEPTELDPWQASINALIKAKQETNRPAVVISTFTEGIPGHVREMLIQNGITPLQGVDEAFAALNANTYFSSQQQMQMFQTEARTLLLPVQWTNTNAGTTVLNEWEGKQLLAGYGVSVPQGRLLSHSLDELSTIKELSPPFAVKAVSKGITHKSDIGAVKVNIQDHTEVIQVINQMNHDLADKTNDIDDILFLVEEMVPGVVLEMTIGIKRDDQFGPALVVGAGGELVNFLNDTAVIMLPANEQNIRKALGSLKCMELLNGFRGRPKGDMEALVNTVQSIASFAEQYYDEILEMDVNPLLVLPEGKGTIAVDTFIRLANTTQIDIA
ncbi:MAG TPA: acetate--CoA ligase family protein [Lentibacillus sp.]|uniref:acetate--CoA ligase family protein n=1 Tax=Lentibacillus sp. TaxID=1925746 RepID=UPI002B4B1FE0|nr:acetate--CoA ligase family protein [Lentibacillus sp.]HLR63794.1 acetate--CoA ligase family protein [Lentibacillus sp.]